MTLLRRLSYATLILAFAQIVFGAIVRITGSGLGCGDHWPKCYGQWFPPLDRPDLIIEITHRYIAAGLTLVIIGLVVTAWMNRRAPGVGGRGGVLRPAMLSFGLVALAAIFGAITVKLDLHSHVVSVHKMIAVTLLAVLAVTVVRAGGFGVRSLPTVGAGDTTGATKTYKAALSAAILAFMVIAFGALTANIVGSNGSCQGFPLCRSVLTGGAPLHIQLTHRGLAFLLFFHLLGMVIASRKRIQPVLLKKATWLAFGVVFLQLVIAAGLVEMHLPPVWRSLHQAVGTLIWLVVFTLTVLARRASKGAATLASSASHGSRRSA